MRSGTTIRSLFRACYLFLERLIVPSLRDSQFAYIDRINAAVHSRMRWLDMGCGHQIAPAWTKLAESSLMARVALVVGVDRDEYNLRRHGSIRNRVLADLQALPFRDRAFDLVTANMVMEHVQEPESAVTQVARILKPGGMFVFHTPNVRNYLTICARALPQAVKNKLVPLLEGRKEEDVFPAHYRINTPEAIRCIAVRAGLRVRGLVIASTSAETVMLGPGVILELLLLRILSAPRFEKFRANIIATLERPPVPVSVAEAGQDLENGPVGCAPL